MSREHAFYDLHKLTTEELELEADMQCINIQRRGLSERMYRAKLIMNISTQYRQNGTIAADKGVRGVKLFLNSKGKKNKLNMDVVH